MTQTSLNSTKEQILASFQQVLADRRRFGSKVATKEEEAEKEKNVALLETASTYTEDSIVKGLADLQLDFGNAIESLSDRLQTECDKLDELRRAIAIETDRDRELQRVRVVADALYILTQEHQEKLRNLEDETSRQQEALEKDMADKRKAWDKEQQEFETLAEEARQDLEKTRQQAEADFTYELNRKREIEADEYEQERRTLERELSEKQQEKDKDWGDREKVLSDNQAKLEEYRQKVETFEEELKQAYTKAKEEAIAKINREENVKAELVEKEWEGQENAYQLKIQSLQTKIQRQEQLITDISDQLKAATQQAKDLAMRAFANSSSSN